MGRARRRRAGRRATGRSCARAVSIAALCELAEEAAGGGKLEELRAQLLSLRLTEHPEGIEEAEEAALELERTIGAPPRLATPAYLDAVGRGDAPARAGARRRSGLAVRRGDEEAQPRSSEELEPDVLGGYKAELS